MLVVRRIPPLLLLYRWIPDVDNWREALFAGHFGPMGVGAVFISTMALEYLPHPHDPPIGQNERLAAVLQPVVFFVVLGSILIHGLSIPFLTLGKKVRTMSVSTWSRNPTGENGGQPEWTTLTRRVFSGDEVVINKDVVVTPSNLERGQQLSRVATSVKSSAITPSATTPMHSGMATPKEGEVVMVEKRVSTVAFRDMAPLEPALVAKRIRELAPAAAAAREEGGGEARSADRLDGSSSDDSVTMITKHENEVSNSHSGKGPQ